MSEPTITVDETVTGPPTDHNPGGAVDFPVADVLQGRGFICGISGSAKSNSVAVIAEEAVVQKTIEEAKEMARPRYAKGVVAALLDAQGPVTQAEVADRLGIESDANVLKRARPLEDLGVITMEGSGAERTFDFDFDAAAEIKQRVQQQERTKSLMEDL